MSTAQNRYKADLKDFYFVLFQQFAWDELAKSERFQAWGIEEAKAVIEQTYRFCREVIGPINSVGDREGTKLVDGKVITPSAFKAAWKGLAEGGFCSLGVPVDHGGQGAPTMLAAVVEEMLSGANVAFQIYPGLSRGAADVIGQCGTEQQKQVYIEKMLNGTWTGTMCLTEPQAGSDVGSATTKAVKQADGRYKITGNKIFISGGDHDLTDNIIHMVLARVEGAPAGTKGLSLFIVPKMRLENGKSNDVHCTGVEHKMGINGSATCALSFGDNGECLGELVGTVENVGMAQMFKMMNTARIAVGLQALSVAGSAYQNALEYAKDRKQGANFKFWKDPTKPRVAIIEHPDVRRMLLEMKASTEGIRALIVKLAMHNDLADVYAGKDDEKSSYHRGQVDLLTPLVKSHASDESFRLCGQAMQVYGGAGYLKDWPVEQYTRDSKIFAIYEGTNHIQAMDLVGRKLGQNGGGNFQGFMADIQAFVEANRKHEVLGADVERLSAASEAVMQVAMGMLGWSQGDKVELVPLNANRFLTMMSVTSVGWMLLDAGVKAHAAKAKGGDAAFYEGKIASAKWYARNTIPQVEAMAKMAQLEDSSPMDLSIEGFASE